MNMANSTPPAQPSPAPDPIVNTARMWNYAKFTKDCKQKKKKNLVLLVQLMLKPF